MERRSVTAEAEELVENHRKKEYGYYKFTFSRIAAIWSVILNREITESEVALCMIGLKLARLSNKYSRDGAVDICGYAELLSKLNEEED